MATLDGRPVLDAQCRLQGGGGGGLPTECEVSCGRVAAAGKEHRIEVTIRDAQQRRVSSAHVIPFVLHMPSTEGSDEGYSIAVLPMRLMHGNRQKIPYSFPLDGTSPVASPSYVQAAADSCHTDTLHLGQRAQEVADRGGEDADDVAWALFHRDVTLDVSGLLGRLQNQVRVGGLGNVSLSWPAGHGGVLGRANAYRIVPISYAAYPEFIRPHPLPKVYDVAPYRPGAQSDYRHHRLYGPLQEAEYFDDYSRSFFGFTRRKAGWDCMRHYEILAAGAIPYFANLSDVPANTMASFPKALVQEAMSMPGLDVALSADGSTLARASIDHAVFNHSHYFVLLDRLQAWTRRHLTTVALAQRVLRVMGLGPHTWDRAKVLFLVHPGGFGVSRHGALEAGCDVNDCFRM